LKMSKLLLLLFFLVWFPETLHLLISC
jgi:hypothetical protein